MQNNLITLLVVAFASAAVSVGAQTIITPRGEVEIKVPDNYSPERPAPLVVLLHGYTSSGAGQDAYMKFSALVNEFGFLLLLPDGTMEQAGQKNRFWNATTACCNMQGSDVDDSTYLIDLINQTKSSYSVDAQRVYLIGHSNGGFMSHRMAYDHPDSIAAIASLAGAAPAELTGDRPTRPVHILQIHGSDDATIKLGGGQIRGNAYPSAAQTMRMWAQYNTGQVQVIPTTNTLDLDASVPGEETTITRYDTQGNMELWTIHRGAHVPSLSKTFTRRVIEWLWAHPKKP